jgi:histidinol-phosphate aminotransferase
MDKRGGVILKRILAESGELDTYDVGETIEGLAAKLGKEPSKILKLNSNENFFVPIGFLRRTLKEVVEEVDPRIYPRDETRDLREALSRYIKVPAEEIAIGTGSDQLIDLVSRMLLRRGDQAVSIDPTFSIYKRCVKIQGASYRAIPLKEDCSLDGKGMLASVTPRTRLLFLCSPNNPTANQFDRQQIKLLAGNFEGLVAVDEAYVDFSDGSIVDLVERYENLVVFRTFSKVFGLAGLRVGCAITSPRLAKVMNEKFQMPYSVTLIALKTALKLLEKTETIRAAIEDVKAERSRLTGRLNEIDGVEAFDSKTNFVLFHLNKSSDEVCGALLKKGIIVRNIGRVLHFENCLRVTVAPRPMMERFLNALTQVLDQDVS